MRIKGKERKIKLKPTMINRRYTQKIKLLKQKIGLTHQHNRLMLTLNGCYLLQQLLPLFIMRSEIKLNVKKSMSNMLDGSNSSTGNNLLKLATAISLWEFTILKSLCFKRVWHALSKLFISEQLSSEQISTQHVQIVY